MMRSTRIGKLLKWVSIILIVVIVIYALGWLYVGRSVKARIFNFLEGQGEKNISVKCDDISYQGFPVYFGFSCNGLHLRDRGIGTTLTIPKLLAEAPVYSPWAVLAIVEGPATLQNNIGALAQGGWAHLGGKLIYHGGVPRLVSFDTNGLALHFGEDEEKDTSLTVERAKVLVRNDNGDLDIAVTGTNAILWPKDVSEALPPVLVNVLVTVDDGGTLLGAKIRPKDLRGKSGIVNQAVLKIGSTQSQIAISGRFSVDEQGYLDGRFSFELTGIEAVSDFIQRAVPEAKDVASTVSDLVRTFTGGQHSIKLDIRISHGRVMMGFIPLGKIPPL